MNVDVHVRRRGHGRPHLSLAAGINLARLISSSFSSRKAATIPDAMGGSRMMAPAKLENLYTIS